MRIIDVDTDQAATDATTFMIYGPTGGGKTRLAASFPRPLFLADVVEGGYETIRTMPRDVWYEPSRKPEVWGIETIADVFSCLIKAKEHVTKRPGEILTLVIDSVTFVADLVLSQLLKTEKGRNGEPDTRAAYGKLLTFLREFQIQAHQIPGLKHIVWLGLDAPSEDGGGLLVPGKARQKMPAACKYVLYQRQVRTKDTLEFETWSRPVAGATVVRVRDEGRFPEMIPNCTFRDIEEVMGWGSQLPPARPVQSLNNNKRVVQPVHRAGPVRR